MTPERRDALVREHELILERYRKAASVTAPEADRGWKILEDLVFERIAELYSKRTTSSN